MRKRKLVENPKQVQHKCQIPFLNWLDANQFPTRLANYRHLGLVSLLYETYSISAALYCQITPVDFQCQPHIFTNPLYYIHQRDCLDVL